MGLWLRLFYNAAFTLLFLGGWPYYLWRLWRRGRLTQGFGQRFGWFDTTTRERLGDGCDLWIHAVSVGENMIARSLVTELRQLQPDLKIVISATTPTGLRVAREDTHPLTTVIYSPLDFFWVPPRVLDLIRPRRLLLIEAEVWPNLVYEAKRRKIPVYLINARLSPKSEVRYARFRQWTRQLFGELDLIFAQDESDIPRLVRSGFPPERIFNLGSFKYDVAQVSHATPLEWSKHLGWPDHALVLMGGSTHPGEEELLLEFFQEHRSRFPDLRLILAPRHAERSPAIRAAALERSIPVAIRSNLAQDHASAEVLILDSTGELRHVYALARVVFVGKSLLGHGGQNFIEACQAGAAVVLGPNMENFSFLVQHFVEQNAVVQVRDMAEWKSALLHLLENSAERERLAQAGQAAFTANCGAAARTARAVMESLRAF